MDNEFAAGGTMNIETIVDRVRHDVLGASLDVFNIDHIATIAASIETSIFMANNASKAGRFANSFDLLRQGLNMSDREGLVLEFGVASGSTLRAIADHWSGDVFGFDSFEGLPEDWRPGFPAGMFAQNPPDMPSNASLVRGWFDESLPEFIRSHAGHG